MDASDDVPETPNNDGSEESSIPSEEEEESIESVEEENEDYIHFEECDLVSQTPNSEERDKMKKEALIQAYIDAFRQKEYETRKNGYLQDRLFQTMKRKAKVLKQMNERAHHILKKREVKLAQGTPSASNQLPDHENGHNGITEDERNLEAPVPHPENDGLPLISQAEEIQEPKIVQRRRTMWTLQSTSEVAVQNPSWLLTEFEPSPKDKYKQVRLRILNQINHKNDIEAKCKINVAILRKTLKVWKMLEFRLFSYILRNIRFYSTISLNSSPIPKSWTVVKDIPCKCKENIPIEPFLNHISSIYKKMKQSLSCMHFHRDQLELSIRDLDHFALQTGGLDMTEFKQLNLEHGKLSRMLAQGEQVTRAAYEKAQNAFVLIAHHQEKLRTVDGEVSKEKLHLRAEKMSQAAQQMVTREVMTKLQNVQKSIDRLEHESGILENVRLMVDFQRSYNNVMKLREKRREKVNVLKDATVVIHHYQHFLHENKLHHDQTRLPRQKGYQIRNGLLSQKRCGGKRYCANDMKFLHAGILSCKSRPKLPKIDYETFDEWTEKLNCKCDIKPILPPLFPN